MDFRSSYPYTYPHTYPQQSTQGGHEFYSTENLPEPDRRRPLYHSTPLPQTQWSDLPSPHIPQPPTRDHQPSPPPLRTGTHLRPPPAHNEFPGRQTSTGPRKERWRRGFRDLFSGSQKPERPTDHARLYPQISPYDNRLSTYSAPETLEHPHILRSASDNLTGSNFMMPFSPDDPSPMAIPRSPTYPPPSRRRVHGTIGAHDAAFTDDADFRLFAEATVGIGPGHPYEDSPITNRDNHPSSSVSGRHGMSYRPFGSYDLPDGEWVSPIEEGSGTVMALQHLAGTPEAPQPSPRPQPQRPLSTSSLDGWYQQSDRPRVANDNVNIPDVSPLEESEDEDELPDYAASQAQAQAHQRAEATRRAQELQRRWQLTGSRRAI